MRFKLNFQIFTGTFLCLLLSSHLASGQTYSFRNYGSENSELNGFIYTIVQSDDGFLWVGTGNGIERFDGFNTYKIQYPDSSQVRIATSSMKDKNGTLWFGCNDGTVYHSDKNTLVQVMLSGEKSISDLIEGPDGLIYIIPQGTAIFTVNPSGEHEIHSYPISGEPVMYSAAFAGPGKLLI